MVAPCAMLLGSHEIRMTPLRKNSSSDFSAQTELGNSANCHGATTTACIRKQRCRPFALGCHFPHVGQMEIALQAPAGGGVRSVTIGSIAPELAACFPELSRGWLRVVQGCYGFGHVDETSKWLQNEHNHTGLRRVFASITSKRPQG